MRKKVFLIGLLCAIFLISSCDEAARNKKLIGGIIDTRASDLENVVSSSEVLNDEGEISGIEIPAPLENASEQILKRPAYTVSYNKDNKIPNWVAWHLTAQRLNGKAKRPQKAFHEDEEVPEPRATDWDYYGSGYDRGHMCPAADNKWSEEAMYESFLFTNMCPQTHKLNAGDWEELENSCRKWARTYGDIYIVCGPLLYNTKHKTIGKNKVVVPEAFFKVVLCLKDKPRAIGFIYKNNDDDKPMGDYVNTVDEVERLTGIDFFPNLPDDIEDLVEATCDLNDWK